MDKVTVFSRRTWKSRRIARFARVGRSYEGFCVEPYPWGLGHEPGAIEALSGVRREWEAED